MKIFYIINRQILMILNEIKELIKVARVLLKKKIIAYDNKSELFSLYTMTWKGPEIHLRVTIRWCGRGLGVLPNSDCCKYKSGRYMYQTGNRD